MGGGAWPFLVGGVICLVNSVNERDLSLLTSHAGPKGRGARPSPPPRAADFLEGLSASSRWKFEAITGL